MAKDLAGMPVGSEGNLSLKVEEGKLVLEVKHDHASGSVALVVKESPRYFATKLKDLVPGTFDDSFIDKFVEAIEGL